MSIRGKTAVGKQLSAWQKSTHLMDNQLARVMHLQDGSNEESCRKNIRNSKKVGVESQITTIKKFAAAFGVDVDTFLAGPLTDRDFFYEEVECRSCGGNQFTAEFQGKTHSVHDETVEIGEILPQAIQSTALILQKRNRRTLEQLTGVSEINGREKMSNLIRICSCLNLEPGVLPIPAQVNQALVGIMKRLEWKPLETGDIFSHVGIFAPDLSLSGMKVREDTTEKTVQYISRLGAEQRSTLAEEIRIHDTALLSKLIHGELDAATQCHSLIHEILLAPMERLKRNYVEAALNLILENVTKALINEQRSGQRLGRNLMSNYHSRIADLLDNQLFDPYSFEWALRAEHFLGKALVLGILFLPENDEI